MTKSDLAYYRIRAEIIDGTMRPGSEVDQEALALRLGLSTTPVREALRRLEEQELVVSQAHRNTRVAPLSRRVIEDTYAVRLALDPMAASLAATVASADEIKTMRRYLEVDATRLSPQDLLHRNRDLHRSIYAACGNPVLVRHLESLWDRCDRYRSAILQGFTGAGTPEDDHRRIVEAEDDHRKIVDAIARHDSDTAAALMGPHVSASLETIRRAAPLENGSD
ncbi:MAG: GntR family transcriptional regulator [Nocardioides sp.]